MLIAKLKTVFKFSFFVLFYLIYMYIKTIPVKTINSVQ